jgi:hypothetical protein
MTWFISVVSDQHQHNRLPWLSCHSTFPLLMPSFITNVITPHRDIVHRLKSTSISSRIDFEESIDQKGGCKCSTRPLDECGWGPAASLSRARGLEELQAQRNFRLNRKQLVTI